MRIIPRSWTAHVTYCLAVRQLLSGRQTSSVPNIHILFPNGPDHVKRVCIVATKYYNCNVFSVDEIRDDDQCKIVGFLFGGLEDKY
jgi:hypothetical protein